jgi:hypothetical protein
MDIFDYFVHARMQTEIDRNRFDSMHSQQDIFELEGRMRALEGTTRALWALLKAKTGWTDEELVEQAKTVEAASGTCPGCGRRVLVKTSPKCSWCGHPLQGGLPVS